MSEDKSKARELWSLRNILRDERGRHGVRSSRYNISNSNPVLKIQDKNLEGDA